MLRYLKEAEDIFVKWLDSIVAKSYCVVFIYLIVNLVIYVSAVTLFVIVLGFY